MSIAYLNGCYLPLKKMTISVLDRGFLFGDGIYEVIPVYYGRVFRQSAHIKRLAYSLNEIAIDLELAFLPTLFKSLLAKNSSFTEQFIYLQITRGADTKRELAIPAHIKPTIFAYCVPLTHQIAQQEQGLSAITVTDFRWLRCDIKSINLLPHILMMKQARDHQADEAIFVREGYVTEGTSSNLFIVKDHVVYTPPLGKWLLGGITRELVLELLSQAKITCKQQPILEQQLVTADEVWLTSSVKEIKPVTKINGGFVGNGKPGPVWRSVFNLYQAFKHSLQSNC